MSDDVLTPADRHAPSPLKRVRYRFEALILAGFEGVVRRLPYRGMLGLADAIAFLAYPVLPDRKVALANLDIAFGITKTPSQKRRIARASVRNLCRTVVGIFWATNLTRARFDELVEFAPGSERTIADQARSGRGVVICTPHYGNWELGAHAVAFGGMPMLIVGEPTRNPAVGDVLARLRGVSGHGHVPPQFALLKLFRQVARGGATAVLVDVNGRRGRGGVWCDFFGLPVFNSTAVADLALRTKATILIGLAHPLPHGRVRIEYLPPVPALDTGDRAVDGKRITDEITRAVESLVRAHPEHWLWTYKRWKRRPTDVDARYPFYSKFQKVD